MSKTKKIAVLGGGISGLATAHYITKYYPNYKVTLFEKDNELGGKIHTRYENGFSYETAANGILSSREEAFELAKELECPTIESNQNANTRYLMKNGKLVPIPKTLSIVQLLKWRQISVFSKISLLKDIFYKKSDLDMTIDSFAEKHFGREIADYVINPICNGIFGSDIKKLSLQSCLPLFYNLQKSHGSIIKGLIHKKKNNEKKSSPPILQSFQGGMQTLITHLEKTLNDKITIKLDCEINQIDNNIISANEQNLNFDYIVSTLPTYQLFSILKNQKIKNYLKQIKYNNMAGVYLGYDNLTQDNAFGYLVPKREKAKVLGVLYSSSIFPQHNEKALFRIMLGEEKIQNLMNLEDEQIMKIAKEELEKTIKLQLKPCFEKIIRWKNSIPIYSLNHQQIVQQIELENKNNPLIVSGSGLFGISVNDCIKQAKKINQYIN